jgi:hypothetical protein
MRSIDQINKVVEWIDGTTIHRLRNPEDEGAAVGFAWTLYDLDLKLLKTLIPVVSKDLPNISHKDIKTLKQSLGNLFLWGDGFRDGMLENILEESDDLKETLVDLLVEIARLLISRESSYVAVNTSVRLTFSKEIAARVRSRSTVDDVEALVEELEVVLEKGRILREPAPDSEGSYNCGNPDLEEIEDNDELSISINSLATYTQCLMDLVPSMENTLNFASQVKVEDQTSSPLDFHVSGPSRAYIFNIYDRFSKANPRLVERLGEANWQRHVALRKGTTNQAERISTAIEEAPKSVFIPVSLFQDSGLGTSLLAQTSYAHTTASHTSFVSSQADDDGGGLRVPPTPKAVPKGIPFSCEICGQTLSRIKNRIDWKYDKAPRCPNRNYLLISPDDMFSQISNHIFALSRIVKMHLEHSRPGKCGKSMSLTNIVSIPFCAVRSAQAVFHQPRERIISKLCMESYWRKQYRLKCMNKERLKRRQHFYAPCVYVFLESPGGIS